MTDQESKKISKKKPGRPKKRRERTPLGGFKSRMSFKDQDPNYSYRYINDEEGRLQQALEGDYEFVHSEKSAGDAEVGRDQSVDSRVSVQAGTTKDGGAMRSYLMKIPKKFYDEDQAAKESKLKEGESAIKHGNKGEDERYVVSNKIE